MRQTPEGNLSFLNEGGEMGRLTREKEWDKTSLGNPDCWPQNLRTTLNILLNSKFPMFLFWGPDLVCFYNDAYRPSLGKEGKHPVILGMKGKEAWREVWDVIKPLIDQVLEKGEATWSEDQLIPIYRNGRIEDVWWTFSYSPVNDESGRVEGVFVTCNETTGQVLARRKIEENERRFRLLTDALPQLVWETDEKGSLLFASSRWKEYAGIQPKDEADWKSLVHPDDYSNHPKLGIKSFTNGTVLRNELRIKSSGGEYRWHTGISEPVYNEENKIIKWIGVYTDVHNEKEFTKELQKQVHEHTTELIKLNEHLRKSEERYHLMVEEVQDYAILYLNPEGIVENWNLGAEKIKGFTAKEIIGKNFSTFYTEYDRKNNLPQFLLEQARKTGKAVQEGWRVRKDGSLFWASVVITAVHDKGNNVIGFSKVTHDLTYKKEADDRLKMTATQLEDQNRELEYMNRELQSFAYISSHDLQEPLRKIQSLSSLIMAREQEHLSEEGKDNFRRLQKAAKRMQTLIEDLLVYSRTTTTERKFKRTGLKVIVEEVKEDFKDALKQTHGTIETEEMCEADIIAFQFHQLIYNLVSNALKFSITGQPLRIKVKSEIAEGAAFNEETLMPKIKYCHLRISDNGIGFEQQYNRKIFEVFQRLHSREEYDGTGIGLAIVKKIVDNHDGIITAHGEPGEGAAFDIYFPAEHNN